MNVINSQTIFRYPWRATESQCFDFEFELCCFIQAHIFIKSWLFCQNFLKTLIICCHAVLDYSVNSSLKKHCNASNIAIALYTFM